MNPRKLLDWRKALVYAHRWLGIAGMLVFLVWFASGIVFLYADMPALSAGERLMRLRPLDVSGVRVTPAEAVRHVAPPATRLRVAMLGERPVYRFLSGARWTAVYADTGAPVLGLSADAALGIVRNFAPEHTRGVRYDARLLDSDQWSLYDEIRSQMPLHRVALDDGADTYYYVTEQTGDVILKTTASGRRWAYSSAVMHWLYFTPLRRHGEFWSDLVVCLSLIGCVMCLTGLFWGVWRYSFNRRYRLRGEHSYSPYSGMMKWHHYAGLLFGCFGLTWAFSGALSLNPFQSLRERPQTMHQAEAAAGGAINFAPVSLERLKSTAAVISSVFPPKELEYLQFRGEPFFMAYRPATPDEPGPGMNGDVTGLLSLSLDREHVIVSAFSPERGPFTRFEDDAMMAVVAAAMPGVAVRDVTWLHDYDAYYYARKIARPLPVLRVRFEDDQGTWLYLDPQHGTIASRLESRDRARRWLYHGFHSMDWPFLYDRRPLWDIVIIGLCVAGIAVSGTTLVPAWRRLRRHSRALTASSYQPPAVGSLHPEREGYARNDRSE